MTEPLKRFSQAAPNLSALLYTLKLLGDALMREYEEGGLKQRAMSLVYISLLSLAPMLAVSFSILKGFGVHNQVEPLLLEFLAPLGEKGIEITDHIIGFVENIKVGVLGFVGFLMLFYTAISLLGQIEDCFNYIWRVSKPRLLYRRFTDYLSVILIGPVFLFSALGITASMGSSHVVKVLTQMEPFGAVYYMLGMILPYLLIITAFSFAYAFIPNVKVKLIPALVGGIAAGVTWKLTGALFTRFIADSAQYSAIYSGFAVILLAMIWLYMSWQILLLGSVITFHVQYPRYLRYDKRRPHLSIQAQEKLTVALMVLIAKQHLKGGVPCSLSGLADAVNVPWEPVADILHYLQQAHLLMKLDGDANFVLAHDTDAISLKQILNAIRSAGDPLDITCPPMDADLIENRTLRDLMDAADN